MTAKIVQPYANELFNKMYIHDHKILQLHVYYVMGLLLSWLLYSTE